MARISAIGGSCTEWTETKPNSSSDNLWKPVRLSFPTLGDETYAVRLTEKHGQVAGIDFGDTVVDFVFVRTGDFIIFVNNMRTDADRGGKLDTQEVVHKALDKFSTTSTFEGGNQGESSALKSR